jgi:hypothetical protein
MAAETHEFWRMTLFPVDAKTSRRRWEMTTQESGEYHYLLRAQDGPIEVVPIVAEAENLTMVEDVPLNYASVILASARARQIFDDLGPGDIQWIPVTVR